MSKGSLTIGCYYSISALWMPEILTAFRARYPGVTVRMQEGGNLEMARWLNERSVDCCVRRADARRQVRLAACLS